MATKMTFTKNQIKEMKRLYVEEKMGTANIGKIFEAHKAVISRTLKENGVDVIQPGRRDLGGKKAADKRYAEKHKEEIAAYQKEWSAENRDDLREYHQEWRDNNRDKVRTWARTYERKRRAENPKYRLAARTRTAVYTCLKERNVAKYRSTFEILGYTIEELMRHLESKFTEGMTWENYGEWHVDHIVPMAKFNFTCVEDREFKLCWCLENLQPMWEFDNLTKGSRI